MKAILIDDEPHNLYNLKALLETYCPQVDICALALDAEQGKATVVAALGLDGARTMLDECVADALRLLEDYGPSAERLREVIRFFATREH